MRNIRYNGKCKTNNNSFFFFALLNLANYDMTHINKNDEFILYIYRASSKFTRMESSNFLRKSPNK